MGFSLHFLMNMIISSQPINTISGYSRSLPGSGPMNMVVKIKKRVETLFSVN